MRFSNFQNVILCLSTIIVVGCGGGGDSSKGGSEASSDETAQPVDARMSESEVTEALAFEHPGAKAYYAENADFFFVKTPSDLPADLKWEDGNDLAAFASPDAIQYGIEHIAIPDYPATLRKVGPDSSTSFRGFIHDNLDLSLVKKHPETGDYYPGLAKEWAISEDRKTVYFRIDPDAEFSDGVPVQTKHFFFTVYFMRSDWIRAPWYQNWYSDKYTSLTKFDDHTFAVGLTDAKPDTLRFFEEDFFPLPEHFYNEFGEDYVERYAWRFEPTTGAYVIRDEDIKKGRTITQTRQKDWWANDKKFWSNRYNPIQREFTAVRDPDKIIESVIAGQFDSVRIRTPDVWDDKIGDREPAQKGWITRAQFYNEVPRPCYSFRLNKTHALLKNRDIREGLQYATDFDGAIAQYFRGQNERMQSSSDGYGEFTNTEIKARSFDPEKAREFFAKAGFTKSSPDGILMNAAGEKLTFIVTTGYKRYTDVLTIIQQSARRAGVDYELEIIDPTTAWKKVQEKKHEIVFSALNRSVEKYPRYHDFWHSYNAFKEDGSLKPDTNNFTVTAYPEWDTLIDKYERSSDLEELRTIAHELEVKIHEDASFIPGWVRPYFQCAYWSYIQWPEGFSNRLVRDYDELNTHWIDPDLKKEILAARREGRDLGAKTLIFDQNKP